MDLLKSPLYSKYVQSNAKLVNFAGWEMPITFSGLIKEHESVRSSAGLFDISHMGVISIKGINPKDYIQKFFPTNLYSFSEGQGLYTVMLNEQGGIIDDLIIYDLGIQENEISEVLLIVNASRYDIDFQWIKNNLNNYESIINEYLVVGHTDTKGTNKYNLSLSIKRAEVVKEILINYGIQQSSIKILGKGEESLAVDTPDDTKQPANRRVEIKKTN